MNSTNEAYETTAHSVTPDPVFNSILQSSCDWQSIPDCEDQPGWLNQPPTKLCINEDDVPIESVFHTISIDFIRVASSWNQGVFRGLKLVLSEEPTFIPFLLQPSRFFKFCIDVY